MADLFARTQLNWGGAFAADKGLLAATNGLSGILLQNLQITYAQNITRVYEIGNAGSLTSIYYVGGRSQGTLTVAHIIGPKIAMLAFYCNFSDVCKAQNNTIAIALQAQCDTAVGIQISYTAKFCVLTQVGVSVAAQDFVINESSQIMFSNLSYTEAGNDCSTLPAP